MSYRTLLISVVLATGASLAGVAQADIVAGENGIAVKASDGQAPGRGMTMNQVATKFGSPTNKVPAVGNPPISRWDYPGFVVYFERDHVIHSVMSDSAAPAPVLNEAPREEPAAAPAAAAPVVSEPAAAALPAAPPPPPEAAPASPPPSAPASDAAPADQATPAP